MATVGTAHEPQVMGVAFLGIFKFIKAQPEGRELFPRVLAALPAESAPLFHKKVIAVAQYPYRVFAQFLRAVVEVVGYGDLAVCYHIGRYTADLDYDFFFGSRQQRLTPQDLLRDCNIYWQSYYPGAGSMEAVERTPQNSSVRIYHFAEMDRAHCRLMEGWMARVMERAGVEWLEHRETCCTSRGNAYHEFRGRWQPKAVEWEENMTPVPSTRPRSVKPV